MKVCVFSSSSNAIDPVYIHEAVKLSHLIGQKKMTLVNGGANVGLMETVLKEVVTSGGKTIGILPEKLNGHKLASEYAQELIISKDMMERKSLMRELSDAFIALPGGFGTLEEILEVITLKQLDYHKKAIVFVNTNGFYDHLFQQFERSFNENFAKASYRDLYFVAKDSEEAINYLLNYAPPAPVNKWYKVPQK
ncbi:TIGR00730 family Rossman fold protein [uncultured Sunxiuqinia sp.]|uniref:LOG family protein n=1 Tax=Sunxiuqinia rutila TaxID=1397841 RepID=UPI002625066B|nr:TIGR00730 family Rossman fold protein [uncultured Sunxiuqinia sp.]